MTPPRILVAPHLPWLVDAVRDGGGEPVAPGGVDDAADVDAVVWGDPRDAASLRALLDRSPAIEWVQLPFAGIEPFAEVLDPDHVWTCGKGVYAEPVAEMALGLALTGLRGLHGYARARSWGAPVGRNLLGADAVVVGGGGITEALVRLLAPFGGRTTVVRRTATPFAGATATVTLDALDEVLPRADVVFLALALTPSTAGLFDGRRLRLLRPHAWIVNVARGGHIVTDDLVRVLADDAIGGAALDVTDPEPLPDGHPLWSSPRCIITPHIGNTPEMGRPLLAERVRENVRRFAAGEELLGPVDVQAGY